MSRQCLNSSFSHSLTLSLDQMILEKIRGCNVMSGVGCMYSSINILISDVVIRITSIKALSAINLLIVGFAEL